MDCIMNTPLICGGKQKKKKEIKILLDNSDSPDSYLRFKSSPSRIDFVLVYRKSIVDKKRFARDKLQTFQENLKNQGLLLEVDDEELRDEVYVKIHAPFNVLSRYAEVLKQRMPITRIGGEPSVCVYESSGLWSFICKVTRRLGIYKHLTTEHDGLPPLQPPITWPFAQNKEYLFDVPNNIDDFFSFNERTYIVYYVLRHCKYASGKFSFGIGKLLDDRVFLAAYPMHDGPITGSSGQRSLRTDLCKHWATIKKWYKLQPLDHVKEYFGAEVAIYFAWMGHYIFCLIFLSIVCIISLVWGVVIVVEDELAAEVCKDGKDIIMCPICYQNCPFWRLSDSCQYVWLSRLFNNSNTIFITIVISIWGMFFNIYWQRSQAEYVHRWNLPDTTIELEPIRPEFNQYMQTLELKDAQTLNNSPFNALQQKVEKVALKGRMPTLFLTFSTVILLILLSCTFVLGVIVYRVSVFAALKGEKLFFAKNAAFISVGSAAFLNLCIIVILALLYERLAIWLTDKELLRTDSEYNDSLALKLYLLEFVNNYASVFYIAFFKGKFADKPDAKPFGWEYLVEKCDVGGCMIEVTIQMVVIFIGKMIMMNLKDPTIIILTRIFQRLKDGKIKCKEPFANDFQLCSFDEIQLFLEYMEMMIQYGFMCFFIAAFPLAPIFALANNIIEIRRDSYKLIRKYRRPVPKPINGIGVWSKILFTITKLAPLSNALIIAMTSDFIPRFVYLTTYSSSYSLRGFTNFSLSYYAISKYESESFPPGDISTTYGNASYCRYRQFRHAPWESEPYEYTSVYYEILAAKLVFVVVFQNAMLALLEMISWLFSHRPHRLTEHIHKESLLVSDFIIRSEVTLAKCQPVFMRLKTTKKQKSRATRKMFTDAAHKLTRESLLVEEGQVENSVHHPEDYSPRDHLSSRVVEGAKEDPLAVAYKLKSDKPETHL